jgi:maleate cis-trans isomerase
MHHFGVLIPSTNRTVETEYNRLLPPDLQAHAARIPLLPHGPGDDDEVVYQARLLASAQVAVISLAQTSGTLQPLDYDERLAGRIRQEAGIPAVTSAQAIGEASRALGARRIAIVSPYKQSVLDQAKVYYEDKFGLTVAAMVGFSGAETFTYAMLGPEHARDAMAKLDPTGIEAIVLPGGNFPTMRFVAAWEDAFGRPIITTNGAALWAMLRMMGAARTLPGLGRLLAG